MHDFRQQTAQLYAKSSQKKGRGRGRSKCKSTHENHRKTPQERKGADTRYQACVKWKKQDLKESNGPHMNKGKSHEECKYTENAHKQKEAWPAQAMNMLCRIKQKTTETTHVTIMERTNPSGKEQKPQTILRPHTS